MNKLWLALAAVLALIATGTYFWLRQAAPPPSPAQVVPPPAIAQPPATEAPAPAVKYPVQLPPGISELPPLAQADDFVKERITELLGARNVLAMIEIDNFVRRVVATVDNLARPLAPPGRWPVNPTPGRFTVEAGKDSSVISAKNAARYAAFVALVESVDSARAFALYQRLYPLFQSAYEGLGYPGKHFNDRLVAVIDLLLDTPEASGALKVEVPEVKGPNKPARPWLLYQYSDPALEALSSGQKILLRVGPDNAKRLKAKLTEFRQLLTGGKAGR